MTTDDAEIIAAETAHYDEHWQDEGPDEPEHVKVSRPNRARSAVLSVRFNPDELAAVQAYAEEHGVPASTVVRGFVLRELRHGFEAGDPIELLRAAQADLKRVERALRATHGAA